MTSSRKLLVAAGVATIGLCSALALAQHPGSNPRPGITTPKEAFGFNIGDDYHLANYVQLESYWKKLAGESDRMKLVSIGKTTEGRTQWMAIISAPENIQHLDKYEAISHKLSMAKGLSDDEARALAKEGKAVVWIDGGLHSTEVVGAQQIIQLVYDLNADTDAETMRFLNDDIVLAVLDNPDGMDLVSDWYNRNPNLEERRTSAVPRLWNHYAGHDDNRDFFMSNLDETTNITNVLFRTWNPQIMYNHHQTGPPGTVIFVPPFRDPFNYHFDPLMPVKIEDVGMAIHTRFIEEDKPGSTMRSGATYSTWYNGGLRTSTYFHNQIGILTEIIGNPTPEQLPLVPADQLAHNDLPDPIKPQLWHFAQSIAYEQTANRAILDYASRNREQLLYDIYKMGKDSIEKGEEDSWTITPKRIAALEEAAAAEKPAHNGRAPMGRGPASVPADLYNTVLHDKAHRDPRGYILSADQPDFPTATKFINTLIKNGVTVLQATAEFSVDGKQYPKGSYIVKTDQAYRPHVLDMFEPQDHPDDFKYPGGPPVPPYDATGYTLAFQMGVQVDREYEGFDGPFAPITTNLAAPLPGTITGAANPAGYLVSHAYNDAFTLTNRLLKAGCDVYWMAEPQTAEGKSFAAGALWIPASARSTEIVKQSAEQLGVSAVAAAKAPHGAAYKQKVVRIGLADVYGGNMPSGWLRFLFDQFEFPWKNVYPQEVDAGNLNTKYDVLIFTDGVLRLDGSHDPAEAFYGAQPKPETIPAEFRPWLGRYSVEKTIPVLKQFAEDGGTIIAVGGSTSLGEALGLPMTNGLTEINARHETEPLPAERFYIPGSLIRAQVDNTNPLAYGMPSSLDVFFDKSPAFKLLPNAALEGTSAVAWYQGQKVLDSGWAWGQQYLDGTTAAVSAKVGKGKVFLFGPEITFRGQPHGTFKFLFNGIDFGAATPTKL